MDAINVLLPKATGLGVALESTQDGKCHPAVQLLAKAFEIPFVVGIINANIGGNRWRREVRVSINSITTIDVIIDSSSEANKEMRNRIMFAHFLELQGRELL
jgi:hypothetical protein